METSSEKKTIEDVILWHQVATTDDIPENSGACVMYNGKQIAIYNFTSRGEWYATQNLCPHKQEMALSRGLIGDTAGEPKVACPFHKKSYSLKTGQCLSGDLYEIETYPVKVENGVIFLGITEDLM
jgi:nitrite reductase (NADH) small subunit